MDVALLEYFPTCVGKMLIQGDGVKADTMCTTQLVSNNICEPKSQACLLKSYMKAAKA